MATAAFRSTSRRTSLAGGSTPGSTSYSNPHRRSRSVSRFSHRLQSDDADVAEENNNNNNNWPESANRKGKFVNTVRGSGFPEISLDDLAIELFSLSDVSSSANNDSDGRKGRSLVSDTASFRRGRSVSRRGSRASELRNNNNNNNINNSKKGDGENGGVRRRRSLSVAPKSKSFVSDSENEHFQKTTSRADSLHQNSLQKPTFSSQQRGLRRCSSQKDLLRSHDGYTSYSTTFTDDEGNGAHHLGHEIENRRRVSSAFDKVPCLSSCEQNSMLYKEVQKEYTHPGRDKSVDALKGDNKLPGMAINGGRRSADPDALKAVSTIRRNYKTKLEERSSDRIKASKQLAEEDANKIMEDFISSVEETDFSSFDGERSDTSSIIGGAINPMMHYGHIESFKSPLRFDLYAGDMNDVKFPWLEWETGDDGTPLPRNEIKQHPATPKTVLQDALEERAGQTEPEPSVDSKSSHGSWSPGVANSFCIDTGETRQTEEVESCKNQLLARVPRKPRVDIDDYLKPPSNDNILSEIWKQRERIHSGGLFICNGGSFGKFIL
ncbi:uncharacterized protein LOC141602308 isoform X1 [Silene latifolia]|uniref:uncharacterized protein LOC141602308 isoform X1 n=1 Tax=Silene latifolia TaxID=37657 RepID=UPI003D7785A3